MQELKPYGDLTKLNKCRDLLDTVGRDMLEKIGHSYLDLLETSSAIYEVDGSYATALFTSSYCKFLDRTSRNMCATEDDREALESGKWLCHESCWTEASHGSIETGKPYDLRPCKGGINIYAVPIKAGDKIIGSINFGYGNPPTDEKTIDELTEQFKVNRDDLLRIAGEYRPRPDYIIEAAKRHLHLAAELIGEIYVRKKAEDRLKLTMKELERSNEELRQFAYIASHDLQEPLRMISSYIQLIEQRYKNKLDKDADEFIAFAVDGANRLKDMINGLLAYSRVKTHGKSFAAVNCETVLENALTDLQIAVEENKAVITHDPLPVIAADEAQLAEVFQNLLRNAIRFRKKEELPRIHVSGRKEGGEWVFSFRDNGIGIEPRYKDSLFVMFRRLHGRGEYPGTGIGLAVCKRIVERHSGRIWVESEYGKGSAFNFTIPVSEQAGTNKGGEKV